MTGPRATRDRIVDAAVRLFAERGYRGTTVGHIEQAAGLTPRAGGLYKHFPSKRDVLEAALERHIARNEAIISVMELMPLDDLRSELTLLGRWTLQHLDAQRPFLRTLMRDGDQFPDLVARYHERVVRRSYREATEWLRRKAQQEDLADVDAEAVAAISIGALVSYRVDQVLFGRPPGDLDEERFLRAWVDAWLSVLKPGPAEDRKETARERPGQS